MTTMVAPLKILLNVKTSLDSLSLRNPC